MLVSVQQSESATYTHISPFFSGFPSCLGQHRALSRVRCPFFFLPALLRSVRRLPPNSTCIISPEPFSKFPGCCAGNAVCSVSVWDGKLFSTAPPVSETFQSSLSIWAFSSVCLLFTQAPNHRTLRGKHSFIYSANAGLGIPGPPSPGEASAKRWDARGLSSLTLRFSERVYFS